MRGGSSTPLRRPGKPDEPFASQIGRLAARALARHYYDYYDEYDLVPFPIIYQTDVGEIAKVDIFRISPGDTCRDATSPKLAGTVLANFGGFFRRLLAIQRHPFRGAG